jgi:hypothetical protein
MIHFQYYLSFSFYALENELTLFTENVQLPEIKAPNSQQRQPTISPLNITNSHPMPSFSEPKINEAGEALSTFGPELSEEVKAVLRVLPLDGLLKLKF